MKNPEHMARNLARQILVRFRDVPELAVAWHVMSTMGRRALLAALREDIVLMLARAIRAVQEEIPAQIAPEEATELESTNAARVEIARLAHQNQKERTERHRITRANQNAVVDAWNRLRRLDETEAEAYLLATAHALRVDAGWLRDQWEHHGAKILP